MKYIIPLVLLVLFPFFLHNITFCDSVDDKGTVPIYNCKITNSFPHDKNAFTQGLVFEEGFLYESTGLRGQSTLRKIDLRTGEILKTVSLKVNFFGEGITILNGKTYQLTWQDNVAFVYDKNNLNFLHKFFFDTEGWGLTNNGKNLIMSDGTSTIYFRDPETFKNIKQITVSDNNGPVKGLNELEYINGEIFANIWKSNLIARIDPKTGKVKSWINLEGLLTDKEKQNSGVLNGIAYDKKNDRLFVTGKNWSKIFEIEIIPDEK